MMRKLTIDQRRKVYARALLTMERSYAKNRKLGNPSLLVEGMCVHISRAVHHLRYDRYSTFFFTVPAWPEYYDFRPKRISEDKPGYWFDRSLKSNGDKKRLAIMKLLAEGKPNPRKVKHIKQPITNGETN